MSGRFFDDKYLLLCSEKTLQTNREGFFLDFANGVCDSVGEKWIKNVFGKLKTDRERINTLYTNDKIKSYIIEFLSNVQEIYRKKCEKSALKCLQSAENGPNDGGKQKLALLSQAVIKAPITSETYALALYQRGVLLIASETYTNAQFDLQAALKANLPPNHKGEAFWKLAICYRAQNEPNKAKVAFNLAEKFFQEENKTIRLLHESQQTEIATKTSAKPAKKPPQIVGQPHARFPNASRHITLKNSPTQGNFFVAKHAIRTGDTLVVEEPHVACLLPEKFGTHCHHCLTRLLAPFGCPECANLAFCGPKCRDEALATYHRHECRLLDLLIGSGMSVLAHTALRMVTQRPLEANLEMPTKSPIFGLCTHAKRRPPTDFLHRTVMAAFLLRCLQKCGYFHGKCDFGVVPDDEQLKVGEMLLFYLEMLQFNAHEIAETVYCPGAGVKGVRSSNIGVALYPTVALFNHDCYPTVMRYFLGKQIVIRALRPLQPGETIAENYGPVFTWKSLIERQRALSARYWFTCVCTACEENWPTLKAVETHQKRIKCPEVGCGHLFTLPMSKTTAECPTCKKNVFLGDRIAELGLVEEQYDAGLKLIDEGELEEAKKVLFAAIDTFHGISAAPHRETHLVQETLRLCMGKEGTAYEALQKKAV